MNLLAPAALALAALSIPIVAMYFLKMRRPARAIPSTFLWEQALRDVQANAPWQRLRRNLLLVLQLLALAALVLALARPYTLRAAAAQGDVVAVLDGSYLMGATDVAQGRFAVARTRIGALIDGLGPNDVMSIVLMARRPRVLIAQSGDRALLHAALDGARLTYEVPDTVSALNVAAALAHGSRHADLFVYAAAGGPSIAAPPGMASVTHVMSLGGSLRDLGIVAFDAVRAPDGTVTTLARVANLGRRRAAATLQVDLLTGDPAHLITTPQVDLHEVTLAPGATTVLARSRLPGNAVAVRARLVSGDDLAADDAAWAVLPVSMPRRILLVEPDTGLPFLGKALRLLPSARLDMVTPESYSSAHARCVDGAVFDTWLPSTLPAAPLLAVGPPSNPRSPLGLAVGRGVPGAGLQKGDDPFDLLQYVSLRDVGVNSITPLSVPAWGYAVLRSGGQAVFVAGQNGAQREAVFGFGQSNTDWMISFGFPIAMYNLLNWLAPADTGPAGIYRPGDAVPLTRAPCASGLAVTDPRGRRSSLQGGESGGAPGAAGGGSTGPSAVEQFVDTGVPGIYYVEQGAPGGTRRSLFAVNLFPFPPSASPAAPGDGGAGTTPRAGKAMIPVEWAPLAAALALLILSGEWWVAARRR